MLSRNPRAGARRSSAPRRGVAWDPESEPAPRSRRSSGRDGVVHLAGESVAQRWSDDAKRAHPREPRDAGRRTSWPACAPPTRARGAGRARRAVGYYGARGDERGRRVRAPPGDDFLAEVCVDWERGREAARRSACASSRCAPASCSTAPGARSRRCSCRSSSASAARWPGATSTCRGSTLDDVVGMYLAALDGERWSGPGQRQRARAGHQRDFSKALGRALHRPAVAAGARAGAAACSTARWPRSSPTGARAVPARATELGYVYRHPDLDEALKAALA